MSNPFQHLKTRSLVGWTLIATFCCSVLLVIITDDQELFIGLCMILFYASAIFWILLKLSEVDGSVYLLAGQADFSKDNLKLLFLTIPLILFSIGSGGFTELLLEHTVPEVAEEFSGYEIISLDTSAAAKFVLLVNILLLAPICEEFIFRGFLLSRLSEKYTKVTAVVLSSLIFALLHISPVGAFIFGVLMCFLYMKTQSLWIPIAVHFLNNAIAVGLYFVPELDQMSSFDSDGMFSNIYVITGSLALSIPGLIYFFHSNKSTLQDELPYFANESQKEINSSIF